MAKLRCVIIDDETIAQDILEEYVSRIDELELLAKCNNAVDAYNLIQKEQVDLAFLDIQMPKLTGIDFLGSLSNPPKVIFTTAYSEYAVKGFELDAIDYLLKPISFDRFLKAVNKALNREQEQKPELQNFKEAFIYLKADGMMVKVLLDDINYIESIRNCIHVHTKNKKVISYISISSIEERLPSSHFIRIHRSFIIAKDKIEAFSQNLVQVGGQKIPVGRNYKDDFQKKLDEYLK
jgi:DNA-binding LytR/AlgR family response regulator